MIKGFYITTVGGVSLLSWKRNNEAKLDEQLFAGLFSAIDRLSESMTGSSIETFQSKQVLYNIKRITDDLNLILVTQLDTDSEFILTVFDTIYRLLEGCDFFTQDDLPITVMGEDTEIFQIISTYLKHSNNEYLLKVKQKSHIEKKGRVALVIETFREKAIYLWRNILLGKRIIITSAEDEKLEKFVPSILLFNPNASKYYIFPKFDIQDVDKLNGKSSYILGSNSSFILMMRKDLWDIHVDLDGKEIKSQHNNLIIEKTEKELFNEVLTMIDVGNPNEEILRELLSNINSKLMTVLRLLQESGSNLKPILKSFNISHEYYTNFLSKLDLNEIL